MTSTQPLDINEYLRRWDAGVTIPSIEMGGMSDAYEQALQICMIEILRRLSQSNLDTSISSSRSPEWDTAVDSIMYEAAEWCETHGNGGLSGAQVEAATNLAFNLWRRGPDGIMQDADVLDRHIQINKHVPLILDFDRG